jgi:hypothetical protein
MAPRLAVMLSLHNLTVAMLYKATPRARGKFSAAYKNVTALCVFASLKCNTARTALSIQFILFVCLLFSVNMSECVSRWLMFVINRRNAWGVDGGRGCMKGEKISAFEC